MIEMLKAFEEFKNDNNYSFEEAIENIKWFWLYIDEEKVQGLVNYLKENFCLEEINFD